MRSFHGFGQRRSGWRLTTLPNRKLNGAITRFQIINRDVTDAELQALTG